VLGTRQERTAATRQRLIDVAVDQFATKRYNEVAVGDIARQAGVAHGLMFHHFGNKRGLYLAAVQEISRRLFELHAPDPSGRPSVQLRQILRQHFERMAQNQDLLLGYVRGSAAMAADPEAWATLEHYRMGMVEWTCEVAGLDPERPALRLMLRAAGDTLDQLSVRWLQQSPEFAIDAVVEAMVHMVTGALRAAQALDPTLDTRRAIKSLT
jgi:AcrR family transcriptional regulator